MTYIRSLGGVTVAITVLRHELNTTTVEELWKSAQKTKFSDEVASDDVPFLLLVRQDSMDVLDMGQVRRAVEYAVFLPLRSVCMYLCM